MSLKAKIEAVIYAAEEPVTLSQIVGLLGLEAEAELGRLADAQHSLALDQSFSSEPDLLNEEIFSIAEDQADEQETESSAPAGHSEPDTGVASSDEVGALIGSTGPRGARQIAREEKERARMVREYLRELLDQLVRDYATPDKGLEIREVAGGFRLATKPEYHDAVRGFVKSLKPPLKLSLQALETLAVVAYKQPVTAPEVSEIRGVDSGGVLGSLMARKLVTTAGRKQVIGRPILYKTTKDFLLRFGLKDINELPSIEEFEKMAGELADNEPVQEEIPMTQNISAESPHSDPELSRANAISGESITGSDLEEGRDATEPQADGDGATVEQVTPEGRLLGIASSANGPDEADSSVAKPERRQTQQNEFQE